MMILLARLSWFCNKAFCIRHQSVIITEFDCKYHGLIANIKCQVLGVKFTFKLGYLKFLYVYIVKAIVCLKKF